MTNKVYGFKMSAMVDMARLEPIVEIANNKKIITTSCPILDINLQTVKVEELNFANQYKIKAEKGGFVNNIVIWFDTFFSHGKQKVRLTTSSS